MDKSADAFRTISEVADELDVPKHVLRFWEIRFPQIKPMKRGGGRRYYRPADMELLRGIRHLLHNEGYTIKGVQKILREQGVEIVKASLASDVSGGRKRSSMAPTPDAASLGGRRRATSLSGRAARATPPLDRKATITLIVRELEAARAMLSGKASGQPVGARPTRRKAAAKTSASSPAEVTRGDRIRRQR